MTAETKCPHCGKPVTHTGLGGICPECMLQAGAPTQGPGDEVGPNGTKIAEPPCCLARGDIAKHFPQLEILECLGRGGMGVVYKARQPKLNRLVALKLLAPEKGADARFAERFAREAQALALLNHPNIVTVYDFGQTEGFCYLLMEFVDGASLRQLLRAGKLILGLLMIFEYLPRYRALTLQETGRVGPLFYSYIVAMNLALVAVALAWVVTRW